MRPARRLNLTAHVASSVGWLGAVVAFLALSIAGLTSENAETVRASYVAMNLIGQFIIVPLSVVALLTGLVQSLGTHWGLVRHYWVLTKFALTVGATVLLLLHQFTAVATAARRVTITSGPTLPDLGRLATQLVFDAGLATLVLLVTTTLSVFKPWGRTGYGLARSDVRLSHDGVVVDRTPLAPRIVLAIIVMFLATIVVLHLTGRGMKAHGM